MQQSIQSFSNLLQFKEADIGSSLVWADFLFELGHHVAIAEPAKAKILLVLPTVDLAAPLITLGYLYGKFNGSSSEKLSIDFFRLLPYGCSLIYHSSTGSQRAIYEGITEYCGDECVRVRVESKAKGGGAHLLLPHQLHKISAAPNADQPISERAVGKNIAGISDFAKSFYGAHNLENVAPMLNNAWLIGRFNELSYELQNIFLSAKQNETAGNFTDLIRANQFLNAGEPSFSCVVSCYKQGLQFNISSNAARLAVFREGISYLRHQHHYKDASKVVLIDFADPNSEYIIATYNEEYYRRSGDWRFESRDVPENVICAGYIEARCA